MNDYAALLQDFADYIKYIEPRSPLTIASYVNDIRHYLDYLLSLGHMDVGTISYHDITKYLVGLKATYSDATVSHKAVSIRQFHRFLYKSNVTPTNPSHYISMKKKGERIPKALSEKGLHALFSFERKTTRDEYDFALLLLLYRCGLRVSELVNLQFSQYYREEKWLRVLGKGEKERLIPVFDDASQSLDHYIDVIRPAWIKQPMPYIFVGPKGSRVSRHYIHYMIKTRAKALGLQEDVSAHTLRHSFATSMLDQGVDLRVIQELLGHSDITTTQVYTHVKNETLRKEYDRYLKGGFRKGDKNND